MQSYIVKFTTNRDMREWFSSYYQIINESLMNIRVWRKEIGIASKGQQSLLFSRPGVGETC
jgi:hypothetical protein